MIRVDFPVYGKQPPSSKPDSTSLACSLSRPMALVFALSGYTGAAPVVVTNGHLAYSGRMHAFCCIFIGVLVIATNLAMVLDVNLDYKLSVRTKDSLTTMVWISDVIFLTLTTSLSVITGPKRIRQVTMILRILAKMDKPRQDHSKGRYLCVAVCLLYTLSLLTYDYVTLMRLIVSEHRHWTICCVYVTFYIQYFLMVLIEMQFMMTALTVGDSLRGVNDALKELLERHSWKINTASLNYLVDRLPPHDVYGLQIDDLRSSKISAVEIQRLATNHSKLCDLVQDLDQVNGPFLLLSVIGLLQHLIITPYYLINDILDDLPLSSRLLQFLWCVFHTINMCAVIEPCHITCDEVKQTEGLLSKLFGHVWSTSEPFSQQIELFFRRIVLRRVEYSPMGICTLNRPLIATIIGGVTTYLVIIVQFKVMNDSLELSE